MTTRADLPRLFASLSVLGTEGEMKGQLAWDRFSGWEPGPQGPPQSGIRGGGGSEAAAEDRRQERAEARRAGEKQEAYRAALTRLDTAVQEVNHLLDMACPPDVSELRNRRTGEFEPETAGDIAASGYCVSCWRNDKQMVVREKAKKSGLYYSPTLCRWCMDVKRTYGVEPPLEMLKLHHAGRRISVSLMEEAVASERRPGKKRRKGTAA